MKQVHVIDSHTGGEPTRVVVSGAPDFGEGTAAEKLQVFRESHDRFRSAVVNEPRGSDVLVGAVVVEPSDRTCVCGVIYFNNVGYLGMCGHGTIGLMVTLHHLGRIQPGEHKIETPVGVISATLHAEGSVSVRNVSSFRKSKGIVVEVPGIGKVKGDVAWGGNWFYLVEEPGWPLELSNVEQLTDVSWKIRHAINAQGFPEVDHVELFGPARSGGNSRNFVLCPGKAYDRSPCGTGTSAKLACLFSERKLKAGEIWRQESITGSVFEGWVETRGSELIPTIKGTAFVNAESKLILNQNDPLCWGIRAA